MKLLDALMGRPSTTMMASNRPDPNAASVGQVVPVAFITTPPSDLTSGSALNQAAVGAWPVMLDGNNKFLGGWRKSTLREVQAHNQSGNYGLVTSQALFGFRFRAFSGIGNSPGPIPDAHRPTFQELTPIQWGLRVTNKNIKNQTTQQHGPITIQTQSATWQGGNTASLTKDGTVLL